MAVTPATREKIAMKIVRLSNRCAQACVYLLLACTFGCTENQSTPPESVVKTAGDKSGDESPPAKAEETPKKQPRIRLGELHLAAREGNIDKVQAALAEGMEVDAADPAERTALMFAAFDG